MSNAKTLPLIIGRILSRIRGSPSFLWKLEGGFKGVKFEGSCKFAGRPLISLAPDSQIIIGDGARINSSVRSNPLACFQPCVLRTLAPGAKLVLGRGVGLSGTALCAAESIEIGEGTIFGSGAMVLDNDFHLPEGEWGWGSGFDISRSTARPVKIGRGVFVGARAIVLKGVEIGDRAVIGAGSVVTKPVPSGHTAVGNPARDFNPKAKV